MLPAASDRHLARPIGPFSRPPDGSRIAFSSQCDGNDKIYVMNADGTGQSNLTKNPALEEFPAWSPDGTRIVFDSDRDGNFEIDVMKADGPNVTRGGPES